MTIAEAAKKGGVSKDTVRRWIKIGRLQATGGGTEWWDITEDALRDALGQGVQEEPPQVQESRAKGVEEVRIEMLERMVQRLEKELDESNARAQARDEEHRALLQAHLALSERVTRALPAKSGGGGIFGRLFKRGEAN